MTKSELEQEIKAIDLDNERLNNIILNASDQINWNKKRRKLAAAQLAAVSAKPEPKTEP